MDPFIDSDSDTGLDQLLAQVVLQSSSSSDSSSDLFSSTGTDSDFNPESIKWSEQPNSTRQRRRRWNILKKPHGLATPEAYVTSRKAAFDLYFTPEIKSEIVKWTNIKMAAKYPDESPIDIIELDAFVGLLLHAGRMGFGSRHFNDIWTTDRMDRMEIYGATMGRRRFCTILSALRFDDLATRNIRKQTDRLAAFRTVSDLFAEACRKHFNPGAQLTVDERMVPFKGNATFRVFTANKPDKYGIKLWLLVDAEFHYILNFDTYLGKIGDVAEKEQGKRVVLQLTDYLDDGYNITTDNFFTSAKLAMKLLQKNKTLLGTLRSQRKEVPPEMKANPARPLHSSIFRFWEHLTMASYVPKKNKAVIMLSTEHYTAEVSNDPDDKEKPKMILEYNRSKCGVDIVDKKVKEYTVRRATRRWTMALFFNLIDLANINSHVIWNQNQIREAKEERKDFMKQLTLELVGEHAKRRSLNSKLQTDLLQSVKALAIISSQSSLSGSSSQVTASTSSSTIDEPSPVAASGRCGKCGSSKRSRTAMKCCKCNAFVCSTHRYNICLDCREN